MLRSSVTNSWKKEKADLRRRFVAASKVAVLEQKTSIKCIVLLSFGSSNATIESEHSQICIKQIKTNRKPDARFCLTTGLIRAINVDIAMIW